MTNSMSSYSHVSNTKKTPIFDYIGWVTRNPYNGLLLSYCNSYMGSIIPYDILIWVFPKIGVKPPKWMVYFMENPIKVHDLRGTQTRMLVPHPAVFSFFFPNYHSADQVTGFCDFHFLYLRFWAILRDFSSPFSTVHG